MSTKTAGKFFSIRRLMLLPLLGALLIAVTPPADAETFKTSYFKVELDHGWEVQGVPQNSERALNVNFENQAYNSKINIQVGSGRVTPEQELKDLRAGIEMQGGHPQQILHKNGYGMFYYQLSGASGFCASAGNGADTSVVIVVGGVQAAESFLKSFYRKDDSLFPF